MGAVVLRTYKKRTGLKTRHYNYAYSEAPRGRNKASGLKA
jgi:hypothetical protein